MPQPDQGARGGNDINIVLIEPGREQPQAAPSVHSNTHVVEVPVLPMARWIPAGELMMELQICLSEDPALFDLWNDAWYDLVDGLRTTDEVVHYWAQLMSFDPCLAGFVTTPAFMGRLRSLLSAARVECYQMRLGRRARRVEWVWD